MKNNSNSLLTQPVLIIVIFAVFISCNQKIQHTSLSGITTDSSGLIAQANNFAVSEKNYNIPTKKTNNYTLDPAAWGIQEGKVNDAIALKNRIQ
ncbi:hypothetical protein LCGC14_1976100, partial [marine sediment metagenome]